MTRQRQSRRALVHRLVALVGAGSAPVWLAACGATGTGDVSPGRPATPARAVTVSFAPGSWGTRAGRKEVTEGMLKEFASRFPQITVDMQLEAPSPTPNESWITRVVAGDVPDL